MLQKVCNYYSYEKAGGQPLVCGQGQTLPRTGPLANTLKEQDILPFVQ